MIEYAVMPLNDYKSACDNIRAKTEGTLPITSNELAVKIDEVFNAGQAEGSANATILYGTYVIKENLTYEEVGSIYVDEDVSDKNIYAYFYDNDTQSYHYKKIIGMMFESQRMPICWYTDDGMQTALINGEWKYIVNGVRGNLPNSKGRIIVFTEPTFITTDFYNAFTSAIDEEFDIFADGKLDGIAEGVEQGADVEKKRWWGIYTNNGTRTAWTYGFAGWAVDCIDPQYNVTPINATSMLTNITASNDRKLNIPEIEARNNIKFDFSRATHFANFIAWGAVEDLGFIDCTSATQINTAFANSSYLKRVSIAIKEDGSQNFSGAFDYANALEELTVVSGYFGSNLNFQWSTKLKKASFVSVISHLLDSASGLSVTFSMTAANAAFSNFDTGTLSDEWYNLIATKPNWSIKLV